MPPKNSGRKGSKRKLKATLSPKKKPKPSKPILAEDIDKENLLYSSSNSDISIEEPIMASEIDKKGTPGAEVMTENEFRTRVLDALGGIREDITNVQTQMTTINSRFDTLEENQDTQSQSIVNLQTEVESQKKSLHNVKIHVKRLQESAGEDKSETVVVKNLWQDGTDEPQKVHEVNKLIKILDPDAPDVQKVESRGKTVGIVQLGQGYKAKIILDKKRTLRTTKPYTKVYLEEEKSKEELKMDASLRAIARVTKGLEYRGGQIVYGKKARAGQHENNQDRNDDERARERQTQREGEERRQNRQEDMEHQDDTRE